MEKVVAYFKRFFGPARAQKIPCDSSIQNEDESRPLTGGDSKSYRSVIGLLLLCCSRPSGCDVCCERIAISHGSPDASCLTTSQKFIGYFKSSGDICARNSQSQILAQGKPEKGAETFWLLETYTDADWSASKRHRKSTSCAVHMVNGNIAYASSRTQRFVSLSSAESDLHSMVPGCSDAIHLTLLGISQL